MTGHKHNENRLIFLGHFRITERGIYMYNTQEAAMAHVVEDEYAIITKYRCEDCGEDMYDAIYETMFQKYLIDHNRDVVEKLGATLGH